jgi:hypothetical protein
LILIAEYIEQLMESPNMLSYALAIAVAISSLILFSTAFFMSQIHRKDDFFWSGIGLFYALVLWYCAKNITGAVLLGQTAATALLVSYCWQTLKLRKAIANPTKAAEINDFSILRSINGLLKSKKPQVKVPTSPVQAPPKSKLTEQEIAIPDTTLAEKTADTTVQESIKQKPKVTRATENQLEPLPTKPTEVDHQSTTTPIEEQPEPPIAAKDKDNQSSNETENLGLKSEDLSAIASEVSQEVENDTPVTEPAAEIANTPQIAEPPKKVSPIDSLETVEVAEVLEAIPEDGMANRDSPDNIIEVTTTEIKVTKEVKQIESNQQDDAESTESN